MQVQYQTARLGAPGRRRTPRAPGGLLANLRVGQKLALTAFAFGIPLSVLVTLLLSGQQQNITVAQQELGGLEQFGPLGDLQRGLGSFVDLTLEKDPAASTAAATVERALRTLNTQVDARHRERLTALEADWQQFKTGAAQDSPAAMLSGYENLLDTYQRPLADDVLDSSGLILDPESASYYTMISTLRTLPRLSAGLRLAYLETEAALRPGAAPELRAAALATLRRESVLAESALTSYQDDVDRAVNADSSLKDSLGAASENLGRTLGPVLTDLRSALADGGNLKAVDTRALEDALRPLTSAYALGTTDLSRLLNGRIARFEGARSVSLLAVGLALLAAFALLVTLSRSIVGPLGLLTRASRSLADGDLNVEVPVRTRDELGLMASTLNRAAGQLRENEAKNELERAEAQKLQHNIGSFLDVTMDIASGDLTKRGQVTEDVLGNVVDSINLMVEELSGVLREVQAAAQAVGSGSAAMLGTTEQIARATDTTSATTRQVSAQVELVAGGMRAMAQDAQLSADAARQALAASEQGQQAVLETLDGMQNIRREVQGVARRIKTLGERSLEIQEIVDTISRLSSQTNLLALNAAIEAAGAGAAGSRFAIVADEVRKLADSSAASTARIATLIKTVQLEIQEVVTSVEDGTREVEQGYRVAGTAGERLRELGRLAGEAAAFSERIREATGQQVRQVEGMNGAVQDIERVAAHSSASVAGGRGAAEDLQRLAAQLGELLTRFRLPA